ncbi:MAG: hypothetical protein H6720_25010 [Sandaracinus sp.]|nr:hypothetical protein [Sandaracinus sp.]MCB9622046.1 hypothetical protein [Sandaracinus sp.]
MNTVPHVSNSATPNGAARFYLEGVDSPVRAHVAHADAGGLTLRQELSFLRLDRRLRDENGRTATLASVGVCLRDGTPSLVLDFRYEGRDDEPTAAVRLERRDSTLPYAFELPSSAELAVDGLAATVDASAPATPPSLPAPTPRKAWHVALWHGVRAAFAAL